MQQHVKHQHAQQQYLQQYARQHAQQHGGSTHSSLHSSSMHGHATANVLAFTTVHMHSSSMHSSTMHQCMADTLTVNQFRPTMLLFDGSAA